MKNKYGNRKVTVDGITFDSRKEATRWQELRLLERAGEIHSLCRQFRFTLIPKQEGERACYYIADFCYIDSRTNQYIVEDAKGYKTPEYRIKRKLMLYVHGIRIREV